MALTKIATDGVKDDAITSGKIPANTVGSSELADNAVDTAAIADQAVALSKLPHGDGSSDGKFLRSNNGADPTFESVSTTPEGTTVLSTGESGGTKFLREDGDGTCSWQALPASGLSNVVEDTTPQLGGDLDSNGHDISVNSGLIEIRHSSCHLDFMENSTTNHRLRNGSGNFQIQKLSDDKNTSTTQFLIDGGTGAVELYHNGTKQCETSANGLAFVSGKGIDFSAAGNASGMSSETLDDYEEGTWTPTVTSGTVGQASTARYTKIGQVVHLQWGLYQFSDNTSSTDINIGGIPFTASDQAVGTWAAQRVDTDGLGTFCTIYGGGSTIQLLLNTGDTTANTMGTVCKHNRLAQTLAYQFMSLTYRTAS